MRKKQVMDNWMWILGGGVIIMALAGWNFTTLLDEIKSFFSPRTGVDELDSSGATISDVEASILAEKLYDAMAGSGTDEEEIFAAVGKMSNRADFNLVYNKFGERQYSRTFGNVGDPITSSRYDLVSWLIFELTGEEQEKLLNSNPQLNIFTR